MEIQLDNYPIKLKGKIKMLKPKKIKRDKGEKILPLKIKFDLTKPNIKRILTETKSPITPPNLLGIERKIA